MPAHSDLDIRMKENYEHPYRIKLTKRIPVIVRIDGKAFHTFTRGFDKPFDTVLIKAMQDTMKYLCENIMGCKIGYCQSDEISLLLTDYDTFQTQPYFDYNIQKIASICASMATLAFNKSFSKEYDQWYMDNRLNILESSIDRLYNAYDSASQNGAMFDARCFNIPREEVTNYFFSRQIDASRNSVEMVGRAYFSHKELYEKTGSMIQDMLHEKYNINWNDFPTEQKRGACCIKETYLIDKDGKEIAEEDINKNPDRIEVADDHISVEKDATIRSRWIIDHEIPQFKGEGREYIERYVDPDRKEGGII